MHCCDVLCVVLGVQTLNWDTAHESLALLTLPFECRDPVPTTLHAAMLLLLLLLLLLGQKRKRETKPLSSKQLLSLHYCHLLNWSVDQNGII